MDRAEQLARMRRRLAELTTRAATAPLSAADLDGLGRLVGQLEALAQQVARDEARLSESRGLALEDTRAVLRQVGPVARAAAREHVLQLRRAGRVRAAARVYLRQLQVAPRDEHYRERLAGFALLLEEHGVRGARSVRSLAASLPDTLDARARADLDDGLSELPIDWDALPERAAVR